MNPFRTSDGVGSVRAPWSRQQATVVSHPCQRRAVAGFGRQDRHDEERWASPVKQPSGGATGARVCPERIRRDGRGTSYVLYSWLISRPLQVSEAAGTPSGCPPVPWCSPTASIHLSMWGGVCGVISKINDAWIVVYYRKKLNLAKPKPVCFWLSEKPACKSHLQALVLGLV